MPCEARLKQAASSEPYRRPDPTRPDPPCHSTLQTVIVARTDAEAASLLDNNVDPRDHPFIMGATVPGTRRVRGCILW